MRNLVTILTEEGMMTLLQKSENVSLPLCAEDKDLILDLKNFIKNNDGLGMSAIQLGSTKNIFVMKKPWNSNNLIAVINPKITRKEGSSVKVEGCFSIPTPKNTGALVKRAQQIFVEFYNESGELISNELFIGIDARVFQHEFDHLKGELMINKNKFQGWSEV